VDGREAVTRAQWTAVATVCEALLDLDVARTCGQVRGGPRVNVDHCRWILRRARAQAIVTRAAVVNVVTKELIVACGGSQ